jgi:hypothetical protein
MMNSRATANALPGHLAFVAAPGTVGFQGARVLAWPGKRCLLSWLACRLLLQGAGGLLVHNTRLLPMLVRPVPWRSLQEGGLLLHGPAAVRTDNKERIRRADQEGSTQLLYCGLNTLNSTPWCAPKLCQAEL